MSRYRSHRATQRSTASQRHAHSTASAASAGHSGYGVLGGSAAGGPQAQPWAAWQRSRCADPWVDSWVDAGTRTPNTRVTECCLCSLSARTPNTRGVTGEPQQPPSLLMLAAANGPVSKATEERFTLRPSLRIPPFPRNPFCCISFAASPFRHESAESYDRSFKSARSATGGGASTSYHRHPPRNGRWGGGGGGGGGGDGGGGGRPPLDGKQSLPQPPPRLKGGLGGGSRLGGLRLPLLADGASSAVGAEDNAIRSGDHDGDLDGEDDGDDTSDADSVLLGAFALPTRDATFDV